MTHENLFRRPDASSPTPVKLMAAFVRLNRLHWKRHLSADLRPHEFALLHAVGRACAEDPAGLRVTDLSRRLGVKPPTVTVQVTELEKRGLVERRREDADRRSVRVLISPAGRDFMMQNRAAILALFEQVAASLGEEKSERLAGLLAEAADVLEDRK